MAITRLIWYKLMKDLVMHHLDAESNVSILKRLASGDCLPGTAGCCTRIGIGILGRVGTAKQGRLVSTQWSSMSSTDRV